MFMFTLEILELFFSPLEDLSSKSVRKRVRSGMKGKAIKLLFKVQLEMFLNRITKYSCVEYRGLSDPGLPILYISTTLCKVADRSTRQQKVTVYASLL